MKKILPPALRGMIPTTIAAVVAVAAVVAAAAEAASLRSAFWTSSLDRDRRSLGRGSVVVIRVLATTSLFGPDLDVEFLQLLLLLLLLGLRAILGAHGFSVRGLWLDAFRPLPPPPLLLSPPRGSLPAWGIWSESTTLLDSEDVVETVLAVLSLPIDRPDSSSENGCDFDTRPEEEESAFSAAARTDARLMTTIQFVQIHSAGGL
mmetsp:Transcript_28119/g.61750  ORF Transcript_28119/g.61750 Transcript_28119/m.61750 type:complete len:205 (+) Transcript_28119:2008-2622(+)